MKLLFHIFRKDVRHFYPEILIHLVLLLAFAITSPILWIPNAPLDASRIPPAMLMFLIPQMWLVMIARLVHDEALVGDRQFWLTRPYPWQILLAAKLVFLLAFLNVPVLLTQAYLLHHADLSVMAAASDLLRYQGLITVMFLLPFLAIAVVTASFGRQILSVVGGLVYLAALIALNDRYRQHAMSAPGLDGILAGVVVLVLGATVLFMYARRPVLEARLTLVCLPPAVLLLTLLLPTQSFVRHAYAASNTGDAVVFDADPKQQQPGADDEPLAFGNDVLLELPVQFQSAHHERESSGDGVQITLRNSDGYTWHSPYQGMNAWLTSRTPASIGVFLPRSVYEKFGAQPVDVDMRIAVQTYAHGAAQTISVPANEAFAVPGHGVCDTSIDATSVQCRFPLHPLPASVSQFQVQEAPCGTRGPVATTTHTERRWIGGLSPALDPVNVQTIFLGEPRPGGLIERHLCPGAQVLVVPVQAMQREELTLRRSGVVLSRYVAPKHHYGNTGHGA